MVQRLRNPFQAQTPIGTAIAGLGDAIFGGRLSPAEIAQQRLENDLIRSRIGSLDAGAQGDLRTLDIQQQMGELAGQAPALREGVVAPTLDIGVGGPARALSSGVAQAGRMDARAALLNIPRGVADLSAGLVTDPLDAAQFARSFTALNPEFTDDDLIRAQAGAGGTIGVNEAVSLGGQGDIATRNAANDEALALAKIGATPRTRSQVEGGILSGLPQATQDLSVGPTHDRVRGQAALDLIASEEAEGDPVTKAQRQVALQGNAFLPTVSVLDESGNAVEVPRDEAAVLASERTTPLSEFPSAVPKAATTQEGLSKSTDAQIQQRIIALQDFDAVMDITEDIAKKSPGLFGLAGNIQRFTQDVSGQADALVSVLGGGDFEAIAAELQTANVDAKHFDPNLSDIGKMATLLAYQGASAIAGQTGRGLSDNDFRKFRQIIGNPTDLLQTQPKFLAGLRRVRQLATRMAKNRIHLLQSGTAGLLDEQQQQAGGADRSVSEMSTEELKALVGAP